MPLGRGGLNRGRRDPTDTHGVVAARQVAAGRRLLVLAAQSSVAAWPPGGVGVPRLPPRRAGSRLLGETPSSGGTHTASWRIRRCHLCHDCRLELFAVVALAPGEAGTLDRDLPLTGDDWILQTDGCGPGPRSDGCGPGPRSDG